MKKLIYITLLLFFVSCNSNNDFINGNYSDDKIDVSKDKVSELDNNIVLESFSDSVYDANYSYYSFNKDNLIAFNVEENAYTLNSFYSNNDNVWSKAYPIVHYDNYMFLNKAKNSDIYFLFNPSVSSENIDIIEPLSNQILSVYTGEKATAHIHTSPNGERIIFPDNSLKKLYLIQRLSLNNWERFELTTDQILFVADLKINNNLVFVKYLSTQFEAKKVLFKISSDYELIEELDLTNILPEGIKIKYHFSIGDKRVSFIDEIIDGNIVIKSLYKYNNNWLYTDDIIIDINTSSLDSLYEYIDSNNNILSISHHNNNEEIISTDIYKFENGIWEIDNEITHSDVELIDNNPMSRRITYNLQNNTFDTCAILEVVYIEKLQKYFNKTKCITTIISD